MIAFLLLASACVSNSPPPQQQPPFPKKTLYIGVTSDHPGFSTFEPGTNRRTGFDIDLARWLGSRLGKDVVFVDVTLKGREEMLKKTPPQVDMVISTFSINDARRDVIDFAGPYMITRQGVMVRKDDDRIKDFAGLTRNNRNICVASGTTSLEQLQDFNGVTLTDETAQKDCVQKLVGEKVDAFSTDELILHGFAKGAPGVRVIDVPFGVQEQYGIGLPNNDKAKCEVITRLLETFINEGAWEDVLARNFDLEKPQDFKPSKLDPCE